MKIQITAQKTLAQISDEFAALFPALRLKFFAEPHGVGEKSSLWDTLNMELPIAEVAAFDHPESLEVTPQMQVQTLEHRFQEMFKIGMQVMRADGDQWIQTTTTDYWTLEEDNIEGQRC
jgi:hypothetical protein